MSMTNERHRIPLQDAPFTSMDKAVLEADQSNPLLCDRIAQRIAAHPQQRITFAEFMDIALYDPQHGYYATNQVNIGVSGDFFTSPHLGADFGEMLAEQFAEMWHLLGNPHPFTLLEMGAGQGMLAQDVLIHLHRHHSQCFKALEYVIVEKSAGMIAEQRQRLQDLANSWGGLHWRTWDEIPADSVVGCCFSNELVDAFPVHQVAIANGQLQEIYVTLANWDAWIEMQEAAESPSATSTLPLFTELLAPLSTPLLAEYFALAGIDLPSPAYPEGYRTEVNLAALEWVSTVAERLHHGYLVTIDYGYPAQRYYSPTRRDGTLQCYYQHARHANPYIHIGQQDITAHVDFTALARQGDRCGLPRLGYVPQGLFLMALGLGDRLAALSQLQPNAALTLQDILHRREALHTLMDFNPTQMGTFGVLVQGKGLTPPQSDLRSLKAV